MATSSMVPYSNPAGKNQTSPSSTISTMPSQGLPIVSPTNPGAANIANPLIPASGTPGITVPSQTVSAVPSTSSTGITAGQVTGTGSTSAAPGQTSAGTGFITSGTDNGMNALQKQYQDIYGQGTGDSLYTLLNSMSGTNSTILQEYIQGLQPQEAAASANLRAGLGAGGVSANSSVAALGEANLQAQEFATISNESANLTAHQEDLTANILQGTQSDSAREVASSGWDILGSVLQDAGSIAGNVLGVGGITGAFGLGKSSVPSKG